MGSIDTSSGASEPIAIVGLSCKFAGDASSPDAFWKLLVDGKSAWSEIPASRFNANGSYHPNAEKLSTMNVRGGHFIKDDIGLFDAPFFSLSAESAAALDPQFRLQLESVYEALENAGIPLSQVAGSNTSVFAGLWVQDYRDNMIRDEDNMPRFFATGTGSAFAANRVSHFFDLRGASMTIDTGCSTALVALHQAIQSLRNGESDMSIVGGSNVMLNPDTFKNMASAGFLSPDGKSYAFDSRANGYGRGDGVATLVIKRLGDAIAAGDTVRAIVRETHINQDGRTESITSPSQAAQVELMRDCYRKAGLSPRNTQYFEAHGTGTATGDPIEAGAVAAVFSDGRTADQALRIGSVKTNIGHTEVTSGLASIIKVVLAMEQGVLPRSINFEQANAKIPLEEWKLKLVNQTEAWPSSAGQTKRASINNFGYGGTNAHVILESASVRTTERAPRPAPGAKVKSKVLVLSARSEDACQRMVNDLGEYFERHQQADNLDEVLENVMYTLGQRRSRLPWVAARRVQLDQSAEELAKNLRSTLFKPARTSRQPRIGMVFTGQGAQWHAMGRELITAYPLYKQTLEEAEQHLKDMGADWSLMDELSKDADTTRVNDTSISIPVCVAVQIALIELLRSWKITPSAVTSHSSGEVAAAYAVGALDLRSAMAVAYYRATITARENSKRTAKGGMIAIGAGIDEAEAYLERLSSGKAVAACINSPTSVTVAGDVAAVEELEKLAKADGVFARRLRVDAAYHSHHMEPIAEPYREMLIKAQLQGPVTGDLDESIAYSSPVTGERMFSAAEIADPEHWVGSLLQPVRFVESVTDMVLGDFDASGSSIDVVLEVGPHTALGGPIKDIIALPEFNGLQLPYFGCLTRNANGRDTLQDLAANLLREGQTIDLAALNFPFRKPDHVRVLTDLPSYPWDHQNRYWQESRLNRAVRERSDAPHELLGSLTAWSSADSPSWRNIVRADDAPWLRDHIVQSAIVYPGAGFVCLAVEAMAQLQRKRGNGDKISAFSLRDVEIELALVVPETAQGIEVLTQFTNVGDKPLGSQGWMHFEVVSITADGRPTTHARGLITAELDGDAAGQASLLASTRDDEQLTGYTRRFDPADFYASLRTLGLKHGSTFQNLQSIVQSSQSDLSMAVLAIPDTSVPKSLPAMNVVHPTTLDTIVQAAYTALPEAGAQLEAPKVPRSIRKLRISSSIAGAPGHEFQAWSKLVHNDAQSMRTDISVFNATSTASTIPVLQIEGLSFQSLGKGAAPEQGARPWEREVCSSVQWAPDMSLLAPAHLQTIKQDLTHPVEPSETETIMELRRVCIYFIHDALATFSQTEIDQLTGHHKKYHTWLASQLQLASEGKLGANSASWAQDSPEERKKRIAAASAASVNGEMCCQLGPHLAAMLRGQQAPLEIMTQDRLLYRYYSHMLKSARSFEQAATLLRKVVHKNPRARILEIGGGTGGETRHALPALGKAADGGPLASLYHFTDVSAAFFEAASQEFSEWSDILKFDQLDVEADPAAQGFEVGSYDVVIACQVLHATKSMAKTMANVRKLMKPNGSLLMVETTRDQVDVQFVFGLLPGWWLSEEEQRHSSPSLSVPFWDEILRGAGFTGVDLEIHDCESDELYSISTLLSTAAPSQPPQLPSTDQVVLVTSNQALPPETWVQSFQKTLAAGTSTLPAVTSIEGASTAAFSGKICVFVGEAADKPLLNALDAASMDGLKVMATASKAVLWLTRGGAVGSEKPEFALAAGFLRALRNEYVGRRFMTLDLDPSTAAWAESSVDAIAQVLKASVGPSVTDDSTAPIDFEYAERNGAILVPRVYKEAAQNDAVVPLPEDAADSSSNNASEEKNAETELFHQPERPLKMNVATPGAIDSLEFVDDDRAFHNDAALADTLVEIQPQAYGANFRDVMVAMGQLEERAMGVECAGIVTRVGSTAAAQGYAVGDRVFCLLQGPYASRACVEWTSVVHMPEGLGFEAAASMPVVYATAFHALHDAARLQAGETVLVHAAAGGVGQAAIVLAQHIGARVLATVGSAEKKALLVERYGVPAENIFSSRDASFAAGVRAATGGVGVDVVLNSLAGALLQASFDVVAPFGRFVEIGKRDLERNSYLEMQPFTRHVSFFSVDMLAMQRLRGREVHRVLKNVARLAAEKVIAPVHPLTVFPISEATKAFRLLQTGKHIGKLVLSTGPEERVAVRGRRDHVRLSPDASYLVVGGLGGIGRSAAHWMAQQGAKNLILMSRSAKASDESTSAFVRQLEARGCRVRVLSCDISSPEALSQALQTCKEANMPAVRGVVQAAMVLQDASFEQMPLSGFQAALGPKVQGTWNLHSQFPNAGDLDFFVLLSSNVGLLGNAGQANYAAAGSYQDAFARWRVAHGLPCVAIDLAAVKGVGFVAETAGVWARMARLGHMALPESVVLRLLGEAIQNKSSAQLVAGLNTGPGVHWDRDSASQLGRDARFTALHYRAPAQQQQAGAANGGAAESLAAQLGAVSSRALAERLVAEALARKLADIFSLPADDIDLSKSPGAYGVDSLVAVELRNMLARHAGAEVSSFAIMQSGSLAALASEAASKSSYVDASLS